jgi:ribosomal protein S18 acetylase RimI-like enzyme
MNDSVHIRPVSESDWGDIVALEADAYTALGLSEGRAALESRVRASPTTCFVLVLERRLAGYLLALPYPLYEFPGLGRREETAFPSRNLHLHDLVIADDLRGSGLGKRLLRHLTARARLAGYEQISLVAVDGTGAFWAANGFADHSGLVNSESYGPSSAYMSMTLPSEHIGSSSPTSGQLSGASSRDEVS